MMESDIDDSSFGLVDRSEKKKWADSSVWKRLIWRSGRDQPIRMERRNDASGIYEPKGKRQGEDSPYYLPGPSEKDDPDKGSRNNWVKGMKLCTYIASFIFVLNLALTIAACSIAFSKNIGPTPNFLTATVFHGTCTTTKRAIVGLHLLINVLSTVLLGASNYCMQGLVAPDRNDVDRAHAQRKWLDIGTNSVRNLRTLSWRKRILFLLLILTSTPIHLVYNSTIFSSLGLNEFQVLYTSHEMDPSDIASNAPTCWSADFEQSIFSFADEISQGKYRAMTPAECYEDALNPYVPSRGMAVVQLDYEGTQPADSLFYYPDPIKIASRLSIWEDYTIGAVYPMQFDLWEASVPTAQGTVTFTLQNVTDIDNPSVDHYWEKNKVHEVGTFEVTDFDSDFGTLLGYLETGLNATTWREKLSNASKWENATWASQVTTTKLGNVCTSTMERQPDSLGKFFNVQGCLALEGVQHCELLISPALCVVVLICNGIKVICMFLATSRSRREVLITLGDGIASFLERPDPTTSGYCMLSRATVQRWTHLSKDKPSSDEDSTPPPTELPTRKRWAHAVTPWGWGLSIGVCIIILGVSSGLLAYGLHLLQNAGYSTKPSALWNLGWGSLNDKNQASLGLNSNTQSSVPTMLVANTPQLILTIAYFFYNRVLTNMLLAAEYDSYAQKRKTLRVSWPKAPQRSTFYLTLPYRYSIPFTIASIALHWLVSQSLFYVLIKTYTLGATAEQGQIHLSLCAWSPVAVIFALALSAAMVIVILGLALRPMKSQMPVVGNCSAAISAACHPPLDDVDASTQPLMWGEVSDTLGDIGLETDAFGRRTDLKGYAHCTFTSREVVTPSLLRLYA
ncbi:hypothetical protein BDV25DRAFT_135078 [Aspergillus avenaceus]|uniref:DUF6536 domain-containing protein n=1 Tax=Aspergillus avenaceus TaxID=36643 RepID=A0A5N6U9R2_ASPAV|nr:hypothetical protein BDV25DRAFT_135078 [Aspergillus avenaceus]